MLAQTLAQAQVTLFDPFDFAHGLLNSFLFVILQGVAETAPDRAPEDVRCLFI
jgi:hypothetical protein